VVTLATAIKKKLKLIHTTTRTAFIPNPVKGKSMVELLFLIYGRDICVCEKCNGRVIYYPRGKTFALPEINCSLT
jgi:hypothetical protein